MNFTQIYQVIFILLLCNTKFLSNAKFLGEFYTKVDSITNYKNIPRDKIDWKLYVRKTGRYGQVLAGYMILKEEVGPLGLTLQIEKYGDGGYKKFLMPGTDSKNVCVDKIYKLVMANYNGTIDPECIFKPGKRFLTPFDIDEEMHKHVQSTIYGTFKIGMHFNANGRDVMGFEVVLTFDSLSSRKGGKSRGK